MPQQTPPIPADRGGFSHFHVGRLPLMRGNILRIALRGLREHKMRSLLAMLGVFLGAFMLTLVLHVSQSLALKVDGETQKLGANIVDVGAGKNPFSRGGINRAGGRNAATLKPRDAEAIASGVPQAARVVPYALGNITIANGRKVTNCPVVGTTEPFPAVRHMEVQYGRFFTVREVEDRALVGILGHELAGRLFPTPEEAVGHRVKLRSNELLVIGVMREKGSDASGTNVDEQLFVPLSTYMNRIVYQEHLSGIWLRAETRDDMPELAREVETLLSARRRPAPGPPDFSVATSRQANEVQLQAMSLVYTLGAIGAGISFSIGTLGILSIMTLMVRARMIEIGLRRVVGATKRDIVQQFLIESTLMAGIGGIAGTGLALLFLTLMFASGAFPPCYSPGMVCGVIVSSLTCGLVAGAYPAFRAVRVNVLQVLKM